MPTHLNQKKRTFKLATTSFILPDHIIPNVKILGKYFDEIELLIFESRPEHVLPAKKEVKELAILSEQMNVGYNIHLPIDISLTHELKSRRDQAGETVLKIMELFEPLNPSTHTLHLDLPDPVKKGLKQSPHPPAESKDIVQKWYDRTEKELGDLTGRISDPAALSVETLDFPFDIAAPLVEKFNLSVCLDAGHQIKYGYDLLKTFKKFSERISIIHLHGVDFSEKSIKDHTSLDRLPEKYLHQALSILKTYAGVVSLEVFNPENLNRSLSCLSAFFPDIEPIRSLQSPNSLVSKTYRIP